VILCVFLLAGCGGDDQPAVDMSSPMVDLAGADLTPAPGPLGAPCVNNGSCLSLFCHFEPPNTPNSKQVCGCKDGEDPDAQRQACVCNPATCTSCCDGTAHRCGPDNKPDGNNCGNKGQACFNCPAGACIGSSPTKIAYCAPACDSSCMGCCLDGRLCVMGDEDGSCGSGGGACAACNSDQHCVNHQCFPPVDGGTSDGAGPKTDGG
jgi:hypothetical protein